MDVLIIAVFSIAHTSTVGHAGAIVIEHNVVQLFLCIVLIDERFTAILILLLTSELITVVYSNYRTAKGVVGKPSRP